MRPAVMLPTYNEAGNIRAIVQAILRADPNIVVVIVDDDSPDGTGRIADELAQKEERVRVIHRMESPSRASRREPLGRTTGSNERGRGYAGAEGFRYCVAQGFDPILEMDADLSHDPSDIGRFLAESEHWDVVIGSRAVAGGGESGRSGLRRAVTRCAAAYLRVILGLKDIRDPTSGYRCFRRHVLDEIQLDTLISRGPGIVTEILYRCREFRTKEIPIQFRDREHGESKFGMKAMFESLLLAARLRLKGSWRRRNGR